ncbi:MAG: nucleotidyltransferase family protein [Planctomycetota bacterium]|nr:nucleotidyltransferase family protein [Planctomycetota bacterium]
MNRDATTPDDARGPMSWDTHWLHVVVRGDRGPRTLHEAETLARRGGDWTHLLRRVQHEALVPHLAALLERLPSDCVPTDARAALRARLVAHSARCLLSIQQLISSMKALEAAGIEVLTFKGPVLGQLAFGDPLARAYVDVDLLVGRSDRHRAATILARLGYTPEWPVAPGAASFLRHSCSVALKHDRAGDLDLHWGLSTPLMPFALDRTGLGSRTRVIEVGDYPARTMGCEDTLLHACVHAARDDWIYWRAHADVAALLSRAESLNWPLLQRLARQTGTTRMLRIGLLLAMFRARATLPSAITTWARSDPQAVALAIDYQATLDAGRPALQGTRRRIVRAAGLRERVGDKVLVVAGALARASEPRAAETWAPWTWPIRRPLRLLRDVCGQERPPLGGQTP